MPQPRTPSATVNTAPRWASLRHASVAVSQRVNRWFGTSPPRLALVVFAVVIAAFTALLMMPFATADGRPAALHEALFVATSAVSVTGLTPVNTAEHWSPAGHVIILAGIQIGGIGILTLASLVAISVTHHLGVRTRLFAQEGISTGSLGEVGVLIRTVVICSALGQTALAAVLIPRIAALEGSLGAGLWHGTFYAVSAFNNAGFVSHSHGLADLNHDPIVMWTLMVGVFFGSLGFPVLLVLWRHRWHVRRWSIHTKLTLEVTTAFLVLGAAGYAALEWQHSSTLGGLPVWQKIQQALFESVMMRSGGFSTSADGAEESATMLLTNALMFVGGGSASTAGGIKVTTFAVILLAFIAEARGHQESTAHGRTIGAQAVRVAVSVVALGATFVLVSTMSLILITGEDLERPLFESISAFATCGLSSGLTADLPPSGLYVLSGLMFAGRVGIMTFAAALTLRHTHVRLRYPEGRPIIG